MNPMSNSNQGCKDMKQYTKRHSTIDGGGFREKIIGHRSAGTCLKGPLQCAGWPSWSATADQLASKIGHPIGLIFFEEVQV